MLSETNWPELSLKQVPASGVKLKCPPPVERIPVTTTEEQVQVSQPAGTESNLPSNLQHQMAPLNNATPTQAPGNTAAKVPEGPSPHQLKAAAQHDSLTKQVQALHMRDELILQVDLTGVTNSALWQHLYKRPQKHWTVRGLIPKEMKNIVKQLTKTLAKHQQWKGLTAVRELLLAPWQHCINDCLAQDKTPFNPLSDKEIQKAMGYCIRIAKTDPHTLLHQKPTNRGSPMVDLDPTDVVNVAYHTIIRLTGNVWNETEHMLEVSKGINVATTKPHNPIPLQVPAANPPPHRPLAQ